MVRGSSSPDCSPWTREGADASGAFAETDSMILTEVATKRLILRPIDLSDCARIRATAGQREVADTMISIPHPFSAGEAERYVRTRIGQMRRGRGLALGIRTPPESTSAGWWSCVPSTASTPWRS